jgi:protein MpaA
MQTSRPASGLAVVLSASLLIACGERSRRAPASSSLRAPRGASVFAATRGILGRSAQGRPIEFRADGASPDPVVLVVGCIHGDEPAGIAVVRRLQALSPPQGIRLWTVPNLNPDGTRARTRQNAHGVDLNRNFPYRWKRVGTRGDQQYAGPRPLSEPESRIAARVVLRLRPRVTIWFHQPLRLVDESGGDLRVERRFAALTRLPLRRLFRYPGSVAGWENHTLAHATAFVVELPPGRLAPPEAGRLAQAVRRLAATLALTAKRTPGG